MSSDDTMVSLLPTRISEEGTALSSNEGESPLARTCDRGSDQRRIRAPQVDTAKTLKALGKNFSARATAEASRRLFESHGPDKPIRRLWPDPVCKVRVATDCPIDPSARERHAFQ